jgi:7-cyano-7-deazaguanine synthase
MQRAYVLLSGGVDSTTCAYLAKRDWPEVVGVSVYYGQRHSKEIEAAATSCHRLGLRHHTLDLRTIVPRTMLTDPTADVPNISYSDIKGVSPTYVPFRNGLLLSAVSSFIQGERALWDKSIERRYGVAADNLQSGGMNVAKLVELDECRRQLREALGNEWALYFGAHAEDAQNDAYPDCNFQFTGAMANAIYTGTYRQLRLIVPLQWMMKVDIIKLGTELGVHWEDTWSCYRGGDVHCGVCPTCRARRDGFRKAGVPDPTVYAQEEAA